MADIVSKETRSRMMAGIKGKNTKPEMALRRALHARGFRPRLHVKNVLGRPDLVFRKHRAVVFMHGCFWHHHNDCRYATIPTTRPEFWQAKFKSNVARDTVVHDQLLQSDWRVAIIWECALRKPERIELAVELLADWLRSSAAEIEIGSSTVKAEESFERGI